MDNTRFKDIVTELVESTIQSDNNILVDLNLALMKEKEELAHALRRMHDVNRMQAEQNRQLLNEVGTLTNNVESHQYWDDVHNAIIREYFINNEEARNRWDNHVSFHDETYDAAVADNLVLGVQYDGHIELATDGEESDLEEDEEMVIAQAEEDDIANNWL